MARGRLIVGPWSKVPIGGKPMSLVQVIDAHVRPEVRAQIKDPDLAEEAAKLLTEKMRHYQRSASGQTLLPPLP